MNGLGYHLQNDTKIRNRCFTCISKDFLTSADSGGGSVWVLAPRAATPKLSPKPSLRRKRERSVGKSEPVSSRSFLVLEWILLWNPSIAVQHIPEDCWPWRRLRVCWQLYLQNALKQLASVHLALQLLNCRRTRSLFLPWLVKCKNWPYPPNIIWGCPRFSMLIFFLSEHFLNLKLAI